MRGEDSGEQLLATVVRFFFGGGLVVLRENPARCRMYVMSPSECSKAFVFFNPDVSLKSGAAGADRDLSSSKVEPGWVNEYG